MIKAKEALAELKKIESTLIKGCKIKDTFNQTFEFMKFLVNAMEENKNLKTLGTSRGSSSFVNPSQEKFNFNNMPNRKFKITYSDEKGKVITEKEFEFKEAEKIEQAYVEIDFLGDESEGELYLTAMDVTVKHHKETISLIDNS